MDGDDGKAKRGICDLRSVPALPGSSAAAADAGQAGQRAWVTHAVASGWQAVVSPSAVPIFRSPFYSSPPQPHHQHAEPRGVPKALLSRELRATRCAAMSADPDKLVATSPFGFNRGFSVAVGKKGEGPIVRNRGVGTPAARGHS